MPSPIRILGKIAERKDRSAARCNPKSCDTAWKPHPFLKSVLNMMFPVVEMLVYLTQGLTLEPGDIIFTGTPSGVGHARKPDPVWMRNGDVCEIEIEGVGTLRNPIADES